MASLKVSLDRFQGCLVGALIGDCLGVPFEGIAFSQGKGIAMEKITKKLDPKHLSEKRKGSMSYSDDTAMSKSVSASLLHCDKFDPVDMATRFTKDYMAEKNRGYGGGVRDVFNTWAEGGINYKNVYEPSINQFDKTGSYGNGGAMRVAPVALFSKSVTECIDIAKESARLTHTHKQGYMGAVLLALAVNKCLYASKPLNWKDFLDYLLEELSKLESVDILSQEDIETSEESDLDPEDKLYEWTRSELFTYSHQLKVIEELLLLHEKNVHEDDTKSVIQRLGRDISAQQAVPAAIYCFLRNLNSSIEQTLYYAISLGGDTDTVGTMCLAMAGAYHGFASIPESWKNVCESYEDVKLFAERLYDLHT